MKKTFLCLILISLIFAWTSSFGEEGVLRIHFLDVGEGESILIQTPNGKNILIDAGNLITGFKIVEYLKKNNVQNIDHLIFTHHDLDHIGGAFFILQMLKVKNVYDNGQVLTEDMKLASVFRWYEKLVRKNKDYKILKANDAISLDKVVLNVIWPTIPAQFSNFNDNSIVIMLQFGKFRCLLTGDLTCRGEKVLLERAVNLEADILKIGHHGADDANCDEFLKKVAPKIAVMSVDENNVYGYPSNFVIDKLKKIGTTVYRTDKDGDIVLSVFTLNNANFTINIHKFKLNDNKVN